MALIQSPGRTGVADPYAPTRAADGYLTPGRAPSFGGHGSGAQANMNEDARSQNAATAEGRYTHGLQGGKWSADPYERAQQERNFHQTGDFKRFWNPLDPASQLSEKLGSSAYNFRHGLAETMADSANDIKQTAGQTLGQGVHDIRKDASQRGLLYSGIRQGKEGDFRSQVASTMAKQVAQSNADLSKRADSMDEIAANSKLQGMQQSMQAQAQVERMNLENSVNRAQQWQQLASVAGYGLGRYAGGSRGEPSQNPHGAYTNQPDNGGY